MSGKHRDIDHWSRIASEWMEWARTPKHDEFWAYQRHCLRSSGQYRRRSRCGMWRGAGLARFEGMRLPGDGDRSGREKLVSAAKQTVGQPTVTRSRRRLICRSRSSASISPLPTTC
jgi:hypothetical protein